MTSNELRSKFLNFFQKKGHKIVPSSSLLPADPSVLFTTAGMQQFKEYFLGKKSPYGKKVTSCQKCFRTSDIETVGDTSHLTFLEMLGHFSFGDYFKKETIEWTFEFITKVLKISISRITVTVFEGDDKIPFDEESYKIWLKLLPEKQIKRNPRKDNVWGPVGDEGPCGAANEVYIDGLEVATLVFVEYFCAKDGSLMPLSRKGVDVGWGLERLAMISQGKPSVFETDLFSPLINEIPGKDEKAKRIIADHIKGAVFLIAEGILPSNVERGYIARRLLRRVIRYGQSVDLISLAKKAISIYQDVYPEIKSKEEEILTAIKNEEEKFRKTLREGINALKKIYGKVIGGVDPENLPKGMIIKDNVVRIDGKEVFHIYETYGFPPELSQEIMTEWGVKFDNQTMEECKEALKKHQEISRAGAEKKFGGGGEYSPKLHTATHLLHAALREVLGKDVKQMGSDINPSRLRFDFSYPAKMTETEIRKVEEIVNQKIKEDLEVKKSEVNYKDAVKSGALAFFKEKYPEKVTVYSISNFSKEICAGPHVKRTGELGRFKIIKEESSGAGVRRVRAILE